MSIRAGQIQWYSTRLNRVFVALSRKYPRLLAAWFVAGVGVGIAAMFVSVGLLAYTIVSQLAYPAADQVLTAVVRAKLAAPPCARARSGGAQFSKDTGIRTTAPPA